MHAPQKGKKNKKFFFEKKNQKTFSRIFRRGTFKHPV